MLVDADYSAAFLASPAGLFVLDKLADAGLFDVAKVFNHAHPVFCPVTLVKMGKRRAGKMFASFAGAEFLPALSQDRAILYLATDAVSGLGRAFKPAPGAVVLLAQIGTADSAVHATGCNQ